MAILRALNKDTSEVSLDSTDGELYYPSSFLTFSGFDIEFKGNYSAFNPIELTTCYDHEYFEDLTGYLLDLSAGQILDNSVKEKLFNVTVHVKYGYSFCAHDCKLVNAKFLETDREATAESNVTLLSLTLVPRYLTRFTPETNG